MITILLQVLGLALLAAGVALGYMRWIRPLDPLGLQKMGALLLTGLTLAGGFIGSWFWWANEPRSFSWVLPPLAGRMLASAAWSFVVLCLFALQHPTYRRIRLVMLNLFVYLAPLAVVILLFHLDRFDPRAPITYAFFMVVIIMVISSSWYLFRPVRVIADSPLDAQAPSGVVKTWLWGVSILMGLWGLALFITDKGPSTLIWVWPGDLLSSRLIGVMLLTIASGSLYSLRRVDSSRQMIAMTITYSIGLAAASFWNTLAGKAVKPAYIVVFGVIFIVSVILLLADRSLNPQPRRVDTKSRANF